MSEPTLGDKIRARRAALNSAAADVAADVAATKAQEIVTVAVSASSDQIASVIADSVKTYVDDRITQLASDNGLTVAEQVTPAIDIPTPVVAQEDVVTDPAQTA